MSRCHTIAKRFRLVLLFVQLALAAPALALQPGGGQSEFVPVNELPPADQLPAAPLLVAAYAFVWIAVMVYLWSIWRRLGRIEADMRELQKRRSHAGGP
jgi:CcmD family protein